MFAELSSKAVVQKKMTLVTVTERKKFAMLTDSTYQLSCFLMQHCYHNYLLKKQTNKQALKAADFRTVTTQAVKNRR